MCNVLTLTWLNLLLPWYAHRKSQQQHLLVGSANTSWGIFQWNETTAAFTNQIPTVITNTADLETSSPVPAQNIGNIGDYAVVTVGPNATFNQIYYKRGGPTN
jgi:uncharacterized protein (DUF486 family)